MSSDDEVCDSTFKIDSAHDSDSEHEDDNANFYTNNVPDFETADLLNNNNHEITIIYYCKEIGKHIIKENLLTRANNRSLNMETKQLAQKYVRFSPGEPLKADLKNKKSKYHCLKLITFLSKLEVIRKLKQRAIYKINFSSIYCILYIQKI